MLPGSKNSFRGRHFKKRYVSIRFPKIFSIRLRVPLVLSKILRTLLTTKSTLSTTCPTSITACTHSFHETVALDGFAQLFKKESLEERLNAELLMDYQTKRGGKVFLQAIMPPQLEFEHAQKGCGLLGERFALCIRSSSDSFKCKAMCSSFTFTCDCVVSARRDNPKPYKEVRT